MTDAEAFAFHFAELDRQGLDGPVPDGWGRNNEGRWQHDDQCWVGSVEAPHSDNLEFYPAPEHRQALGFILTQALADAGNLTIHATHNGTNTVTTPAFAVHRKPLLAGLVEAYWKMRGDA